ncbi:hypothetical protein, partial [uncultured Duncaniella sp.]|uniref:hypothetical protein n=1 Tax=uncultured Duncaniella sp. TaxID=2768039 RepID=UPI0026E54D07
FHKIRLTSVSNASFYAPHPHKFRPEDQIKTGEQENRIFRPENQRTIKTGEQENNSERKNIESRNMAL